MAFSLKLIGQYVLNQSRHPSMRFLRRFDIDRYLDYPPFGRNSDDMTSRVFT
jgi:hypothetical protein